MVREAPIIAASVSTATATAAVSLLVHSNPYGDDYIGTREQLIAAGLIERGMFPGDFGRKKAIQRFRTPNQLCISRFGRYRFQLHIATSPDERERRKEREQRTQALAAATERERAELNRMPASGEDFQRRIVHHIAASTEVTRRVLNESGDGYRFDAETIANFEWAITEAIRALENGRIAFDSKARDQRIAEIRKRAMAADVDFQTFLACMK